MTGKFLKIFCKNGIDKLFELGKKCVMVSYLTL